jgi:hypothetical protein
MASKAPYEQRTDLEKLQSQWHKLSGLHTREEWSAAVVRAATAAEIAANFAIRQEFAASSRFDAEFVNGLLRWANGLSGKMQRLLDPLWKSQGEKHKHIKELRKLAEAVNERRNAVAHQGEFCNKGEATKAIGNAEQFIHKLIRLYDPAFKLKQRKRNSKRKA